MKSFLKVTALLLGLGFMTACGSSEVNLTKESYIKNIQIPIVEGATDSLTIKVNVEYPVAKKQTALISSIDNTIKHFAFMDSTSSLSVPEAADAYSKLLSDEYIKSNSDLYKDNSDYSAAAFNWEYQIDGKLMTAYKNYQNYELSYYSYQGGAHGYGSLTYYVFDSKTGAKLTLADVFNADASETLSKLLMDNFVKEQVEKAKADGETMSEEDAKDILFEQHIEANDNFYFSDKGITFVYNPYELAAYAFGHIMITLPWEEVNSLLKLKL